MVDRALTASKLKLPKEYVRDLAEAGKQLDSATPALTRSWGTLSTHLPVQAKGKGAGLPPQKALVNINKVTISNLPTTIRPLKIAS